MTQENPNLPATEQANQQDNRHEEHGDHLHEEGNDQVVAAKEVEEFFQRLPGSFRWPKPNAEAVAAAVEAIHRMSGGAAAEAVTTHGSADMLDNTPGDEPGNACSACGGALPAGARFCAWCGISNSEESITGSAVAGPRPNVGQHHFHHHYHHIVPSPAASTGEPSAPRGRAPGAPGSLTGGRSEATARQVVQDWAQACNTRHIDDLLELYAADATVIRSSVAPVRSLPAIREFLISLIEAGLGDLEMESLRVDVMGDIALDLGRCKMLVPVAMGKRREERGKYLVVLVKQPAGTWKILADCWSSDLPVSAQSPDIARKSNDPIPPQRTLR